MEIDWSEVKRITLWSYEELIEKLLKVLSYEFVQKYYNHSMREAAEYVGRLLGYDQKYHVKVSALTELFRKLDAAKIKNFEELLHEIENREKCSEFLGKTVLSFTELIFALNYIFRWVLPFCLYLRELIDPNDETQNGYLEELKKIGIRFNLDVLERGRTEEDRKRISREATIPEAFILILVNRADMTRLPYSNRKTVRHLGAAGYDSVDKIAQADLTRLMEDMRAYFNKIGIRLSRSFIDLEGIMRWAKAIPKIVQN